MLYHSNMILLFGTLLVVGRLAESHLFHNHSVFHKVETCKEMLSEIAIKNLIVSIIKLLLVCPLGLPEAVIKLNNNSLMIVLIKNSHFIYCTL